MDWVRLQEGPVVEWGDIDWHHRTLTVSRAVGLANNNEYLKSVKTNESRTIELNQLAWDAIMDHIENTRITWALVCLRYTMNQFG